MYAAFKDLEKAYDRVYIEGLPSVLKIYGVREKKYVSESKDPSKRGRPLGS